MSKAHVSGIALYMPKQEKDWCRNKDCLRQVSEKVAQFSQQKFGVVLCWECQRLDESERNIVHE